LIVLAWGFNVMEVLYGRSGGRPEATPCVEADSNSDNGMAVDNEKNENNL